jgi:hypothetical protein
VDFCTTGLTTNPTNLIVSLINGRKLRSSPRYSLRNSLKSVSVATGFVEYLGKYKAMCDMDIGRESGPLGGVDWRKINLGSKTSSDCPLRDWELFKSEHVQVEDFYRVLSLAQSIIPMVLAFYIGSWSDHYGRIPFIAAGVICQVRRLTSNLQYILFVKSIQYMKKWNFGGLMPQRAGSFLKSMKSSSGTMALRKFSIFNKV